ncbi:WD repeat-containing protein 6 [Danaus plexippus plexippus]|uniref:tRNA (34-2'-O)-methyltransferase regulator WDR6 n=1 Tax=Danaus plexippus plexippus TaxID=278856 RepID=A0A212FHS8_DANPL|nr:WD repeat-containing protein 6 [Danaus plexippus plexippus]
MSTLIRTDVTSVKLCKDIILAGIGSFLCTFYTKNSKPIQKIQALNGQKIRGLIPSKCLTKLLIFGGKQFTIFNEIESIFKSQIDAVVYDDWIHTAIWLSENKVALLSAHNVVTTWDITTTKLLQQHINKDNSILYSGLLQPLQHDILVFSGTVYSQVILQWFGDEQPLHYLKGHKGVIFSISCNLQRGIIVTTSDDRSVKIWSVTSVHSDYNIKTYWQNAHIDCVHDLYGHLARVMRNTLTNLYIISVGEDSAICFWDYNGNLLKKTISHKNSCIWSLDADESNLVTGGGDCGIMMHPLSSVTYNSHGEVINTSVTPKKVLFTARNNIVITTVGNVLNYYNSNLNKIQEIRLNHTSTYQLVGLSSCKQLIAVVDMDGNLDIFMENCKGDPGLKKIIETRLHLGKILSMQWAGNRHLVFCSEGGVITVGASKGNTIEIIANYLLPPCKERWLTASALHDTKDTLIVGDRCGHIHLYEWRRQQPAYTMKRVHGRYGPTSIDIRNDIVRTTGRDGTVRYLKIINSGFKYMSCKDLEFEWVEKFLDVQGKYVCGFRERSLVVYDVENDLKVVDVSCGGGHRSWDVVRYIENNGGCYEECLRLMFVKNTQVYVNTFRLRDIVSTVILPGTHSKEINCLRTYRRRNDDPVTWFITGGEDTTLRVSTSEQEAEFWDRVIFRHLSNVRALKLLSVSHDEVLVVSAGGRAQICIRTIGFVDKNVTAEELIDYQIKGTDRERRGNQNWRNCSVDFDPETRIMDVEVDELNEAKVMIYTACSDGEVRVFEWNRRGGQFTMIQEVRHHKTCILKLKMFTCSNKKIITTCGTRGDVAFWEVSSEDGTLAEGPALVLRTNESGINSVDIKVTGGCQFVLATGGDDNAVHMSLVRLGGDGGWAAVTSHAYLNAHCSQVTGLALVEGLCVTTGVDQRVTSVSWRLEGEDIKTEFIDQMYSDVSDIHGMDVVRDSGDRLTVCVYGKGIQVIELLKP